MNEARTRNVDLPDVGDVANLDSRREPIWKKTKPLLLSADGTRAFSTEAVV